jgi:hypothetical protein
MPKESLMAGFATVAVSSDFSAGTSTVMVFPVLGSTFVTVLSLYYKR